MPSTGCAFCFHSVRQTRSRTPPAASHAVRSVRRMPAWLPYVGWELRRAASSAPYSPAAAGARRDICRIVEPVRPQPATATPVAWCGAVGCCETDPTDAAIARSPQGSVVCFSGSLSDAPRRLTELNRRGYLASRTLTANSPITVLDDAELARVGNDNVV